MRKKLFMYAVFFTLSISAAGCSSAADKTTPQRQGYSGYGEIGKALQLGATGETGNMEGAGAGAGAGAAGAGYTEGAGAGGGAGGGAIGQTDGKEDYPGQIVGRAYTGSTNTTGGAAITGNTAGKAGTTISAKASDFSIDGGIKLLSIKTPVKLGQSGSLSIQGKSYTQYTITAVYNNSVRTMTASAGKQSGADGKVGWTWDVDRDTIPGTYAVMITGGGELLTTAYTVAR